MTKLNVSGHIQTAFKSFTLQPALWISETTSVSVWQQQGRAWDKFPTHCKKNKKKHITHATEATNLKATSLFEQPISLLRDEILQYNIWMDIVIGPV